MESTHQWRRHILRKLRSKARKQRFKASDVRPHTLVVYAELKQSDSNITFELDQRRTAYVLDNLLSENDAFLADGYALGLHQVKVVGGKEYPGNSAPVFFPDPNIFGGAAIAPGIATEAESLEMIYNGKLNLVTDQHIRIKDLPAGECRIVGQTQGGAATTNQVEGFPIFPLTSAINLHGGSQNKISLSMNGAAGDYSAIEGPASGATKNYAVLILSGSILVRGAAKALDGEMMEYINS